MREKKNFRANLEVLDKQFPEKAVLTMHEAATVLGLNYLTVAKMKDELPIIKIGGRYGISKADLAHFISA